MTVPMIILAIGSVGAGAFLALGDRLMNWLAPAVGEFEEPHPPVAAIVITPPTLAGVAPGAVAAYLLVGRQAVPLVRPEKVGPLVRFARADAGGNAINEALVARPGLWLGKALLYSDDRGVDGAVNGMATGLG